MKTWTSVLCVALVALLCLCAAGCSCLVNGKSDKASGTTGDDNIDEVDDAGDDAVDDDAGDDTAADDAADDADDTGGDDDTCSGFIVQARGGTEICDPAGVRSTFSVALCDGTPVPDITADDFTVINDETGQPFQSEGGSAAFVEALNFDFYTILVLDLSYSIVQNDLLGAEMDGAALMVQELVENQSGNFRHHVAIYVFGSSEHSELIQDFTQDAPTLYSAIDALRLDPGRGSTNLYGAFTHCIDLVMAQGSGDLVARSLVLFTDGTHETGDKERLREYALSKMEETHINSYVLGLQGDYNEQDLRELASAPANFVSVDNATDLSAAFTQVSAQLDAWARSNYVMGVCSPLEGANRSLTIQIRRGDLYGELKVHYNADGFDLVGCSATDVASGVGCEGYTQPGANPPTLSNGFWRTFTGHPPSTHQLVFSVCDPEDDLAGGEIYTWFAGTSTPFFGPYHIYWSDFTGGAPSAPDCDNPLQIGGIPVDFSSYHDITLCCDVEATDGAGHLSNKITDICVELY